MRTDESKPAGSASEVGVSSGAGAGSGSGTPGSLRPVLLVLVSAVLWGTLGSFVTRYMAWGLSRNALMVFRFGMTAVPVLLLTLKREPVALRVSARDLPLFFLNGIVSIVFFTTCYTLAIQYTKIATAAALLYTAPAIVLLLSALLFHERLTARKLLCVGMSVLGCAFVSGLGGGDLGFTTEGLLFGLGAGFGYALYSIFSQMILNRGYPVFTNLFYTFSIATVCYLGLAVSDGGLAELLRNPAAVLLATVCGLLTGFLAYLFYTEGLKGLEPSRAAQIATIEPVTAAVLGAVLFRQSLSGGELLGIGLVLLSVLLMNRPGESG